MDVESTAEADRDESHLAATSAEGKNKSRGRESGGGDSGKVRVEGTTARGIKIILDPQELGSHSPPLELVLRGHISVRRP